VTPLTAFNLTLLRCAARNFSDVHDVALHTIIELDDGFCHCSPAFLQSLDFKSIAALEKIAAYAQFLARARSAPLFERG